jgi:hypothetical protein
VTKKRPALFDQGLDGISGEVTPFPSGGNVASTLTRSEVVSGLGLSAKGEQYILLPTPMVSTSTHLPASPATRLPQRIAQNSSRASILPSAAPKARPKASPAGLPNGDLPTPIFPARPMKPAARCSLKKPRMVKKFNARSAPLSCSFIMKDNKWVRLLAYITAMVNQRLLLQCEYLLAENRILRS